MKSISDDVGLTETYINCLAQKLLLITPELEKETAESNDELSVETKHDSSRYSSPASTVGTLECYEELCPDSLLTETC